MWRFFIFACLLFHFKTYAQSIGSVLPISSGAASALYNPASVINGDSSWELVLLHRSKLLMKPLAESSVMLAYGKSPKSRVGVGMNYTGYTLLNRTHAGVTYARQITDQIAMGVRLDLFHLAQGEHYGSATAITGSCGMHWRVSKYLLSEVYIQNPNRASMADIRTPTKINAAIHWTASKQAVVSFGLRKEGEQSVAYQLQVDYAPSPKVHLKMGVANGFEPFTMGLSVRTHRIEWGMFSAYHMVFGFSPGGYLRIRKV